MVLFDTNVFSLLLHPDAKPPADADGKDIPKCRERIEYLVSSLEKNRTAIVIPTPVLTEFLVLAGDQSAAYINQINGRACFKIADYDQRAAIEAAAQIIKAFNEGDKRSGSTSAWDKVKFDRQIVAIAKVENVNVIYSNDDDVRKFASQVSIDVVGVSELPLPPPEQLSFPPPGNPLPTEESEVAIAPPVQESELPTPDKTTTPTEIGEKT
jgi:predicted nucleic acid-binding protein